MTNTQEHATWGELLYSAVHTPGKLLTAYTAFHNYSFGNALLALTQCHRRNLEPGPLNTYRGWLELKRQVRKGEKGITLCMPMRYKKRVRENDEKTFALRPWRLMTQALRGPENGQSLALRFVFAGTSRLIERFKRGTRKLPNQVNERHGKTLAANYEAEIYGMSFGWFAAIQRSTSSKNACASATISSASVCVATEAWS